MTNALTRTDLDEAISPLRDRLDVVDGRLETIDQRFDGMDQRFDAMDQRFDAMDRRLDGMDRRFDGIDRQFEAVDRQFGALNRRIGSEISRALGVIEERFASLFALLDDKFGGQVASLRRDLDDHIADRTLHATGQEGG